MVSGQGSTLIGAAVKRKEDPRLLTGAGTYTGDVQLRGMTYMAVLRSPHAHAHIRRIEPAADTTVTVDHTPASARQLTHDLLCGVIQLAPTLRPTLILPDDAIEFRRRLLDIDVHLDVALFHFGFNVKQVALQRLINTH